MPKALIVEDSPVHAMLAEITLSDVGFQTQTVLNVKAGLDWIKQQLDHTLTYEPTLIALDMKLPEPLHPQLEGTVLATWTTHEIHMGRLHHVHLVAITSEPTPQREWAAKAAGCSLVFAKPITPDKAHHMRKLLDQPLPTISDDVAVQAFRQGQLDVLQLLDRQWQSMPFVWQPNDVRLALTMLTNVFHLSASEQAYAQERMQQLGGITVARIALRNVLPRLHPAEAKLLALLLDDIPQQTIAGRLGIGRRKLENMIERLLAEIAVLLTTN